MSIFYKKGNNESTKALYQKSLIYRSDILDPEYENLKDFQLAEKYLYGRVSYGYVPIELDLPSTSMGSLDQTNKLGTGFQAVGFVAYAFRELSQQFKKKAMSGQIKTTDPFLSVLEVQKAYESPRTLYRNFSAENKQSIEKTFSDRNLRFKDFDGFMLHLMGVLKASTRQIPFTYPGFIKSRYCPMTATGLVIEVSTESAANDEMKIKNFKESKNWQFYLNACRSYGFSVDSNNPWRLVADIGTPEMIQYAQTAPNSNYRSTSAVLASAYTPAHITYYENFKAILLELYDRVKTDYIHAELCSDGSLRSNVVRPKQYSLNQFNVLYTERFCLESYMRIRLMEERDAPLTENEKQHLVRDSLKLATLKGHADAIGLFESIIGKTYDYSGSLTDLLYRDKISKEEAENVLSNT
jgi:hypothetical protein|tara:strand:+ start:2771 stop:4003 length:1233 start_codon:yes stop_codon:yes gene_type:complete